MEKKRSSSLKWVVLVVALLVLANSFFLMRKATDRPLPTPTRTTATKLRAADKAGAEDAPIPHDQKIAVVVPVRHEHRLPLGIVDELSPLSKSIEFLFVGQRSKISAIAEDEMQQQISKRRGVRLILADNTAAVTPAVDADAAHGADSGADGVSKEPHADLVKSFAELANHGASHTAADTEVLVFLAEFYAPAPETRMLQKLLSALSRSVKAGAAGCQLIRMPEGALAGDISIDPVVVEHGTEVALGRDAKGAAIFVAKGFSGYSIHDARVKSVAEVPMLSPYCMAVRREVFFKMNGFVAGPLKNVVQEVYAATTMKTLQVAVDRLRTSVLGLEQVIETVSISQIQQTSNPLRSLVRKGYNAAVEATGLWEKVTGDKWMSPRKKPVAKAVLEREEAFRSSVAHLPIHDRLGAYLKAVDNNMLLVNEYVSPAEDLAWEEEAGWDFSLRLGAVGLKAYASTGQAVLNHAFLPGHLDDYQKEHPGFSLTGPSVAVNGAFRKRWGEQLKLGHRSRRLHQEAPVKVVWDSFCCNCCGFSNEIVHLTYPLQRLHSVNIVPDPQCFCQGFPNAVMDSLRRNHLTKEQYVVDKATDDEIVVWVSHTDPTGFQQRVFESRKPDYIVGRSMYEFSRVDTNWVIEANSNCDELWVPAEWVQHVFVSSGINKDKIVVMPEAVDTYYFDPSAQRKVQLPPKKWNHWCNKPTPGNRTHPNYKFFSNFKWEPRKGWDIMFRAYYDAFKRGEPVSLHVLTHIWFPGGPETYGDKHNITFLRDEVLSAARQWGVESLDELPHFCFIAHDLTESEVAQVYNSIDAFVLPTRGEGWGLPAIQAMSMAKPTISTNWGGQMEFLKPDYAFLIPLDGVEEIPEDSVYRWKFGKKWGVPSTQGTAELMALVYARQEEASQVGAKARAFIVEHFSEEALARRLDKRLLEIREIVLAKRHGVEGLHQQAGNGADSHNGHA